MLHMISHDDFSMKKFSYKLKSNKDKSAYMSDRRLSDLIRFSEWYMFKLFLVGIVDIFSWFYVTLFAWP